MALRPLCAVYGTLSSTFRFLFSLCSLTTDAITLRLLPVGEDGVLFLFMSGSFGLFGLFGLVYLLRASRRRVLCRKDMLFSWLYCTCTFSAQRWNRRILPANSEHQNIHLFADLVLFLKVIAI